MTEISDAGSAGMIVPNAPAFYYALRSTRTPAGKASAAIFVLAGTLTLVRPVQPSKAHGPI